MGSKKLMNLMDRVEDLSNTVRDLVNKEERETRRRSAQDDEILELVKKAAKETEQTLDEIERLKARVLELELRGTPVSNPKPQPVVEERLVVDLDAVNAQQLVVRIHSVLSNMSSGETRNLAAIARQIAHEVMLFLRGR